eukprot:COSAG06_NODE_9473_length_1890_cov_10.491346_2_plen_149_part_00
MHTGYGRMKRKRTLLHMNESAFGTVTKFTYSVDCKPIDFQWEVKHSSSLTSSYTYLDITSGGIVAFLTDALLDNKHNEEFRLYEPEDNSGGAATDCGDAPEDDCSDMSDSDMSDSDDDGEVPYEESSDAEDSESEDSESEDSESEDSV